MGPYLQVSTVVLSMALVAVGNGVLTTLVPMRLHAAGVGGSEIGLIVTAYAAGMLAGCLGSGSVVRRVGHIRAYSAFASLHAVCALLMGAGEQPVAWLALRAVAGFAVTAMFIVTQSWLNAITATEHRGRVMALFYVSFTASTGAGAWLAGRLGASGPEPFGVAAAVFAVSVTLIALTRLEAPPPPRRSRVDVRAVWAVSPLGLVGVFASGALGMTFVGIGPAWGALEGIEPAVIGTLMACTQGGNLAIQWPLGWLSDRIDRRYVIFVAAALVLASSASVLLLGVGALVPVALAFAVFGGAAESLYALSTAQANDHAGADDYVTVTSTLLVAWSVGATLGPMLGTAAMQAGGPGGLFVYFLCVGASIAAFAVLRKHARPPALLAEHEDFVALPATPVLAELNPNAPAHGSAGER